MKRSRRMSRQYVAALDQALFWQCLLLLASYLVFDSSRPKLFVVVAIAVHWLAMLVMLVVRPSRPTRVDLAVCRWGVAPILALTWLLAQLVWRLVGEHTLYERWRGDPLVSDDANFFPLACAAGIWCALYVTFRILARIRQWR